MDVGGIILFVVLSVAVLLFLGFNVKGLIRDIKNRKNKKKEDTK